MLGPDGEPLDLDGGRRPRGRGARRRLPRRRRVGPAQPARHHRRAGPPPGGDPARLPQVPPARRLALHRELPERRAGGQLGDHGQARALLRAALRPRACETDEAAEARAARGDPRRPRRGRLARPRPHPAQPADGDRRDAAHERLQAATARRWRSSCARPTCRRCPQPAPLFEIYVYSPEVEGIHLRGGPIARGGLRWSDRMDYRTEVYGLMRAQLTKNAIIVPGGRQGRLLHQASRRSTARPRSSASTSPTSARCST